MEITEFTFREKYDIFLLSKHYVSNGSGLPLLMMTGFFIIFLFVSSINCDFEGVKPMTKITTFLNSIYSTIASIISIKVAIPSYRFNLLTSL